MAKTKTTMTRATATKAGAAHKTSKRTCNGRGSDVPDPNEFDDNDDLFPSSGGDDDDDGGGGADNNDSDKSSLYDFNYLDRANMTTLFKTLGFSEAAAKQAIRYEQIDDMEVLAKLTDKWCNNIIKYIQKVQVRGWKTRLLMVSDAALNKFQMAIYVTKHARRTNQILPAHELDTDKFDNLWAQREIKDKACDAKPMLPAGLTLKNDLRVAKMFKSVVERLGQSIDSDLSLQCWDAKVNGDVRIEGLRKL